MKVKQLRSLSLGISLAAQLMNNYSGLALRYQTQIAFLVILILVMGVIAKSSVPYQTQTQSQK
jgi:hypothetical protein